MKAHGDQRVAVSGAATPGLVDHVLGSNLAHRFVAKPWTDGALRAIVAEHLGAREAPRPRGLLVDDDEGFCALIQHWLVDQYDLFLAHDGEQDLRSVRDVRPNVVLLDITMPKLAGFSVDGCSSTIRGTNVSDGAERVFLEFLSEHMTSCERSAPASRPG